MTDCAKPVQIPYVWTEGDTLPEISFVLPGGLLVADFTVTLRLDRPDDTTITRPAIDLGGSEGKFAWAPTDLIPGLGQRSQIDRVDGSGDVQSSEIMLIDVRPRVGS
ncbi:MAG TPA: hypothetical protein ENH89_18700 [Aurantimonas coralicida]|uniref:Uncharacterized protein n=1 Tax=Aurantimonas coralicida TaxID=182270 RepID=A0A9C9NIH6_9HYPH|nr:hypothetical protein [Aurantimonas coralicida]